MAPELIASWRDAIPSKLGEKRWWNDTSSSVGAQLLNFNAGQLSSSTNPKTTKACAGGTKQAFVSFCQLLAQAQFLDQCGVTRSVAVFQVLEQTLAGINHLQQSTATMVVFHVGFEVRGQLVDARGEQRNLNFWRPGVVRAARVVFDDEGFFGDGSGHGVS